MLCSTQRGQDRGMHWRLDDNPGDLSSSSHFPKTPLHGQNPPLTHHLPCVLGNKWTP